jgi:uncharacterized protein (DUF58 family)
VTPDSRRYLHPEAILRISRLELRARAVVEGVLAGLHRSPYKGQSVEFLQHREYVRGDDLRRVDWKVWGRQDRLTVKEFEEETNLRLTLLVDCSASMDYRRQGDSRSLSKYDYAATLAASLAWLALSHGDAVGCVAFDDAIRGSVPARTRRNQLESVCEVLEGRIGPDGAPAGPPGRGRPSDFLPVLRNLAETLPRRGLVVILSDLLGSGGEPAWPGAFKGIRTLRARGHDTVLLHVLDEDELEFPFDGPTRFEGLELPRQIACNPRSLRQGYLEALREFLSNVRRSSAELGCDYALVRTGDPVDATLVEFLSRRAAMAS